METVMSDVVRPWDGDVVRKWLDRRLKAARLDQAAADREGYSAQGDYDKAAAEEWACATLLRDQASDHQAAFAARIKELIARDSYPVSSNYDDVRFERAVRSYLRKVAKMTKTNDGFDRLLRFQ